MSMLDSCYVVYSLRDGYFSGCEKAMELTIKENVQVRKNRYEICKEVLEVAKKDADIKDLVREASPEEMNTIIEKVELGIRAGMDELGGEVCIQLTKEEISIANALVVILLEEGYKISRTRACSVLLSLKDGSLEDCAKSLRSSLRNMIDYKVAEKYCQELAEFASKKSPLFSGVPRKSQVFPADEINHNLKLKVEANQAVLVALAIDNRCHLDEIEVRKIIFVDYPANNIVIDRRRLFDKFLTYYHKHRITKLESRWFRDGALSEVEEQESSIFLETKMEPINLTNQQALQTLHSTYRSLVGSFKETQKLVEEVYYQRRGIPESLRRRFYIQIQLIKYMEKHIGALKEHIESDSTDIFSAENLPYGVSDLKRFSELSKNDWVHSLFEDKDYNEMDHFSLFCPLLQRSAFRLSLLIVGISHGILGKTKVKLPDVCLALTQIKHGKDFKSSIKQALASVFVKNQKIFSIAELETLYNLSVSAVDQAINEFLTGIPEEFINFEDDGEITDERLQRWIAQVEHRLTKVIIEPKAVLGNMSLFDVDMIMQNVSPLEAKLQLLISVVLRRIHEALIDLTNIEDEIGRVRRKMEFARIQTDYSGEISNSKEMEILKKQREIQVQKVIDLVVEHAGYSAKAIDVFDISDRPIVRKVHRIIGVSTEFRRLSISYSKAIQGEPIFKTNKMLLRTSIIKHRMNLAKKVLTELALGEHYNVDDTRWYTDLDKCLSNTIPDLNLPLKIDPRYAVEASSGFTKIEPKNKPPKYNLLCGKKQIRRFRILRSDIAEILKSVRVPIVDFEGKRPLLADILTIEGWAPLMTTIYEEEEPNIPCSIAKQLFRKIVSDISQRVTGGTSFFNIPLMHLWCADHIRFRRGNQAFWRNLIPRIWLIFIDEPLDIIKLKSRKWTLNSWFR
ncbi:transmembrane protein [Cryptosporidium felis]|nr:transmembrane protein [Cryptosporidium felis]